MHVKPNALRRSTFTTLTCLTLLCSPLIGTAQDTQSQSTTAPDNSRKNKAHHKTADQQKDDAADRQLTAKIRRSLIADKSLSMYGHNIKIITVGGAVTLKGPVHTEEEKKAIVAKATEAAGQDKVTDQITISK